MENDATKMAIDAIELGDRHREDMGDVSSLARSIYQNQLLHPIVVTPGGMLIAGARRLAACRKLGWAEVPVRVVDLAEIVRGEFAENVDRKDFLPSELDAIRRKLEPELATPQGRPKNSENFPSIEAARDALIAAPPPGKTADKVGRRIGGYSGKTLMKIRDVMRGGPTQYASDRSWSKWIGPVG